jgi:flagellar biosynthetic protein FliO
VYLKKEKLVVIAAGAVLVLNLLVPSVLLAETIQQDARGGVNTESNVQDKSVDSAFPTTTFEGGAENLPASPASVKKVESELFYKMLLSVALVIALGIAVIYVSKKVLPRFSNLPGKQIRIIETVHIAPRKGLHLVQVGIRRLLIASTNEQITMLADVTESATSFADELASRTKEEK